MLSLDALTLHTTGRPPRCLLQPLSCRIAGGEVLAVLGPSGVGKSSLLLALAGALGPGLRMGGRILLNGQDITDTPLHRRRMGLLFQDAHLFAHLSVGQNLMLGMPANPSAPSDLDPGNTPQHRKARAQSVLAALGLPDHFDRDPATLSGGQKARVALWRTLLAEPRALLLDEPFSSLDDDTREALAPQVWQAVRERGLPTLLVTHHAHDLPPGARVLRLMGEGAFLLEDPTPRTDEAPRA